MQLTINLTDNSRDIASYCFIRISEHWPKCVAVVGGAVFSRPTAGVNTKQSEVNFYQSNDAYLTYKLLNAEPCCIQLTHQQDKIVLTGTLSARPVMDALSRLPGWAHCSNSARLGVVQ